MAKIKHIEVIKKWFDEIDLSKYYPGKNSFDDYVNLAREMDCKVYTDGHWHSGEGYCDDTWEEHLIVETPFGTQVVMTIHEESLNKINYREIPDFEKWYDPEKYTKKHMAPKKEAFLKSLARVKFHGFRFVGDKLEFRKIRADDCERTAFKIEYTETRY